MSCSANPTSWGDCVGGAIGGALGSAGKAVAGGVFDSIAQAFGQAAAAAVTWLWRQIDSATAIDLTGDGIANLLAITGVIAGIIAVAMFAIQVIASALRQDAGGLGRAVRGMLIAFVGAVFAITTTQLLLAAVDDICDGVVRAATGENVTGIGRKLVALQALSALNSAGLFLFAIVLLIAVVVIWAALMIRKMLIIVAAVFAPIAFSGATSDLTRGWVRRWIELTVALICSKLILVLIFMIGLALVDGAGETGGATDQVTNLAIGALTLLLAGFAPWLAIKTVHFAGDAFHHVHAQAVAARSGGAALIAAPQKANSLHAQATSLRSRLTQPTSSPPASSPNGTGPDPQPTATGRPEPPPGPGTPGPSSGGPSSGPTSGPNSGSNSGPAPAGGGGPTSAPADGAGAAGPVAAGAVEAVKLPSRAANTLGRHLDTATPAPVQPSPAGRPPAAPPPKTSPPGPEAHANGDRS